MSRKEMAWRSGLSEGPRLGIGRSCLVLADWFSKGRDIARPFLPGGPEAVLLAIDGGR
jgi:hypothetical protein